MTELNNVKLSSNRQTNIELLRIVSMVLIVLFHFSVNGRFNFPTSSLTLNRFWIQTLYSFGRIGVNVFVMISGYFLITLKSVKVSKVIKMWLQIFTYSFILFAVFAAVGIAPFNFKRIFKCFFPITSSQWWFASTYFVLYLIFPFLNKLLTGLDKSSYQKLLALTAVMWCIIPTVFNLSYQSNLLIWFMFLYALAGYLRLHFDNTSVSCKKCVLITLSIYALTMLSTVAADFIGMKIPVIGKHATYLFGLQKVPCLLISLLLFLGFANMKVKQNKVVNSIAGSMFGVYLIHENPYMRKFIWKILFKIGSFSGSRFLIIYSIGVVAAVFCVCSAIELLRINTIEKRYSKSIEKLSTVIEDKIEKIFTGRFFQKF